MNMVIFYLSLHHKNTKKMVDYLANKFGIKTIDLMTTPLSTAAKEIHQHQLIGFASGIYYSKHHQNLFRLLDKIPKITNKKAFVFSTAGLPFLKFFWHYPLRKKLKEKGFEIVGELSIPGFDTVGFLRYFGGINKGRPNEKDLKKTEEFLLMFQHI